METGAFLEKPPVLRFNEQMETGARVVIAVQLLSLVQLFVVPWTAACQLPYPSI